MMSVFIVMTGASEGGRGESSVREAPVCIDCRQFTVLNLWKWRMTFFGRAAGVGFTSNMNIWTCSQISRLTLCIVALGF